MLYIYRMNPVCEALHAARATWLGVWSPTRLSPEVLGYRLHWDLLCAAAAPAFTVRGAIRALERERQVVLETELDLEGQLDPADLREWAAPRLSASDDALRLARGVRERGRGR